MFIGHNAVAFASKRAAQRTSLGTLMAAAMFLDIAWPVMILLGIEHVRPIPGGAPFLTLEFTDYPWSHSLVTSLGWGLLFGLVVFAFSRNARGAVVSGLAVFSHWVLDFVTHVPDLPLWPAGPKVGLSLWRLPAATVIVESLLFIAGVAIYARTTRARDRVGSIAFWTFVVFLAAMYAVSLGAKPPQDVRAVAWGTLTTILFPIWAWWFDRHRDLRE